VVVRNVERGDGGTVEQTGEVTGVVTTDAVAFKLQVLEDGEGGKALYFGDLVIAEVEVH
jgi:hypothetical protein